MLHRLLNRPGIYRLTQWLWYRAGQQQAYVNRWIRPRPGDRILDIGCGPGTLLELLPDVQYVGYDPNPLYIAEATARFGTRGSFHCGFLTRIPEDELGSFDIVLANGVLHHVSDEEASVLLEIAHQALKPAGRMVTRDGCYEKHQNRLARLLLRWDRGSFVRTQEGYEALFHRHFKSMRIEILRNVLRLPYSLIHCEMMKRS